MKYALIGCGRVAAKHIEAAIENQLEIVSLCDIVPESMEKLLRERHLEKDEEIRRYTDYTKMLEKEKPDLVAIAAQSGAHAKIALDCIRRGIHVIVEKPMALSLKDADSIVEASQKNHTKVCVCHVNRFNPAVLATRKALEEGRFGKLSHGCLQVRFNRGKSYYEAAPWRGTWAEDGGCLMNQCIHGIDLLLFLMGSEAQEVCGFTARRLHPYLQCEDVGVALVKFKNGALGIVEGTVNVFPKNLEETLCIFGETGTVKIGGACADTIQIWQFSDRRGEDEAILSLKESKGETVRGGHVQMYADMIDAVKNDRSPLIGAKAGRSALELVLSIYQSASLGIPVKLPLKDVSTTDFIGKFVKGQGKESE